MSRTTHHDPNYNPTENGIGEFSKSYHLEMLSDRERVSMLKKGIDKVVTEDTVFCELGCGTAIFSIYAAKKASKVYAIEYDKNILEFARHNIEKSGLSHKINLIHSDACSLAELPDKADVVFSETLSIWMIEEPQVLIMNNAVNNLLAPEGATIPRKVINMVELCNTDYVYDDIYLKTSIAQFSGIKAPRVMTESKVFNSFAFDVKNPVEIKDSIPINILTSGVVNSVRLSSIVNIAEDVNFYSTDTLMPLTIVPLENEVHVTEGETVFLQAHYQHRGGLEKTVFKISR